MYLFGGIALGAIVGLLFIAWAIGMVVIKDDQVGVITKKFATKNLENGSLVALNGEAGVQVDTLPPGWHFFFWPWQYSIEKFQNIVVPEGQIALIIANDGKRVTDGRRFGDVVDCNNYQDGRSFLLGGGYKGQQLGKLTTGTYRINQRLFDVITAVSASRHGLNSQLLNVLEIPSQYIGIVKVNDGLELSEGETAAPTVEGHSSFQNEQEFIRNGGHRGLQQDVIRPGSWAINPWFASVEIVAMTVIPVAHVGVVVSAVGPKGEDVSGSDFKNGEIVDNGNRGVWSKPLNPGIYPINIRCMKVEIVPTSNFVLNWNDNRVEGHQLDAELSAITVQSKDGFSFPMEIQQIIHVPYDVAPRLIARFGTMANLVQNVLEPLIGNYFRNAGQSHDMLEFILTRKERQTVAKAYVTDQLREYNVEGVDTLIGSLTPPVELMKTLQDRKIAEENSATITMQMGMEKKRQEKERETALADSQRELVGSEQAVRIARQHADAAREKATGEAAVRVTEANAVAESAKITAQAEGEAMRLKSTNEADSIKLIADANASKITLEGEAEAKVIQQKTTAIGQQQYAQIEVARFLSTSNLKLVPNISFGGASSGVADSLMGMLTLKTVVDSPEKLAALAELTPAKTDK